MPLRSLFLDLNSFFASCEQQEYPDLRGRPVAVVPLLTDSTCAIAASYEAKAYGIKTGTIIKFAKQMCPDLQLVKATHRTYVHYHHKILEAVDSVIPIDHVMSIDELCCTLDRTQREPEAALELGMRVKQAILKHAGECLTCSVGIAPNPFLAKVASNLHKPDGLTLLSSKDLPARLLHLELDDLPGIGPRMLKRLYRCGVFDMQTLWNMSAGQMKAIWGGVGGKRFWMKLHGEDIGILPTQPSTMGHQHVLEPEFRTPSGGLEVAKQLLIKAAERLRMRGFYCRHLTAHAKFTGHAGYWYQDIGFHETRDTAFLLHQLEALWQDYPCLNPLRVGVVLSGLVPVDQHQPNFFETQKRDQALDAVDALNQRYGRNTVSFGYNNPRLKGKADKAKIAFQRVPEIYEV